MPDCRLAGMHHDLCFRVTIVFVLCSCLVHLHIQLECWGRFKTPNYVEDTVTTLVWLFLPGLCSVLCSWHGDLAGSSWLADWYWPAWLELVRLDELAKSTCGAPAELLKR